MLTGRKTPTQTQTPVEWLLLSNYQFTTNLSFYISEDEGFIEITIDPETAVPDDDLFPASIFTPAQNQTDQSAVAPVFTPQTPECLGESVRGKQTSTSKAGPKDMVLQIDEQVVRPSSGSAALSTVCVCVCAELSRQVLSLK